MQNSRNVTFQALIGVKITAKVDTSAPDAVVLDAYLTETQGSLVWLPDDARAAILRQAIVEAKDLEASDVDFDARR